MIQGIPRSHIPKCGIKEQRQKQRESVNGRTRETQQETVFLFQLLYSCIIVFLVALILAVMVTGADLKKTVNTDAGTKAIFYLIP